MEVKHALASLQELVQCRCHEAFKDRGLHDPQCNCDYVEEVEAVTAYIEGLEKKNKDLLVLAIEEYSRAEGLRYALTQCRFIYGIEYERVAEVAATSLRRDLAKVFHEAFTHKYGNQPFNNGK